jgi:hypothetical protein
MDRLRDQHAPLASCSQAFRTFWLPDTIAVPPPVNVIVPSWVSGAAAMAALARSATGPSMPCPPSRPEVTLRQTAYVEVACAGGAASPQSQLRRRRNSTHG